MILVITAERETGLHYHRQIIPFKTLGIDYEIQTTDIGLEDDYLKKFKCISFLRELPDVSRYKKLGLKVHLDIDDYWVLPSTHSLAKVYKLTKKSELTIASLKEADFVTTTTPILADKIKPYNSNVFVLANAINPNEDQWLINPVEVSHNRTRFGYIAGSHHQKDVEMMHPELISLYSDATIKDQWQLVLGGYNFTAMPNGTVEHNKYYQYIERLFTCRFRNGQHLSLLRPWLADRLESTKLCEFRDMDDPYMRLNGGTTYTYAKQYDSIDVSLVPLCANTFNACKSQLKMIEAGFKKKAVMVSDVMPYRLDFTKDNVLVTKDNEWKKNIKYLLNNKNKIVDLQESLHEYVVNRYHIDIVNKERKQVFDQWLK